MNVDEAMRELERLGTEQNRKVYRRHGAGDRLFGVSFANLGVLKKRIKTDHRLAAALWATGNADARTLALMIADPAEATEAEVEGWLGDVQYYLLVDLLVSHVASKVPFSRALLGRWIASEDEWVGRAGWNLVGALAAADGPEADAELEAHLATIERSIHRAKNRTRDAMNSALIQIGARNEALRRKATAAAKRIGKVVVDHGETGCKTPDAAGYIDKVWAHRAQKGAERRTTAAPAAKKAAPAAQKAAPAAKKAAPAAKKAAPAAKKAAPAAKKAAAGKRASA